MRFAANLSMLFEDIPDTCERYRHLTKRTDYVFKAIEAQNPYEKTLKEWNDVISECGSLKWVLINSPSSIWNHDVAKFTIDDYDKILEKTRDYAKVLNVQKVHLIMNDIDNESQIPKVVELLRHGAKYLAPDGITCVVEPLATRPNYYLKSYLLAKNIINDLKEPNLKIMLDTFHLQRLHGNLTANIEELAPYIGHVQISQVPLRDNPVGDGEINHRYILKKIAHVYDDFIGLEYKNQSTDSFNWINELEK